MEKVRVYELAKDLNTTSKRLMEKLGEIGVVVKNHMSLLEDHELQALYKHIGVIQHDDSKKPDNEEKKNIPAAQPRTDRKKDMKNAPRIIRKTEIVIDSNNQDDGQNKHDTSRGGQRNDSRRNNRNDQKYDVIRVADDSGLRAGYVRKTRSEYVRPPKASERSDDNKLKEKSNERVTPAKENAKQEQKLEVKQEAKLDIKQDIKPQIKEEVKLEAQKEIKPEAKKETVPEIKPQDKTVAEAAAKTESKPAVKQQEQSSVNKESAQNSVSRHENRSDGNRQQRSAGRGQDQRYGNNERPQQNVNRNDNRTNDQRPFNQRPTGQRFNDQRPARDGTRANFGGGMQKDGQRRPFNNNRDGAQNTNAPRRPGDMKDGRPPYDRRQPGERSSDGAAGRPSGGRYGDRRPQNSFRPGNKPLEIPKPELSAAQIEEMSSQRSEVRREFMNKDVDKEVKREQRKEVTKTQPGTPAKNKRFKPQNIIVGQKKGVSEVLSEDFILNEFYSDDDVKKTKKLPKNRRDGREEAKPKHIPHRAVLTEVTLSESVTVKDLAETLKKTSTEVIKKLMSLGLMVTLNQEIDFDTAAIVAEEFGIKAHKEVVVNEEDILFDDSDEDESKLVPRPPVVVVMGHVDHGKTSLLDAIRESNVTENEAGGITQHIGAYMVKINNRNITFLDTPGHEAFTAMRARGAQVTDVAILVVAADDGVMPQTVEAINHAKAANVSIIVAVNKTDKPGANPERVKQELTEHGLVVEEWGGDVIAVPVSAKNRTNIDQLLEMVLLSADVLELKANPDAQAKGTIIEAKLDKSRGPVATLLVQRGTLNVGDSLITGTTVGRIRAMTDDKGFSIKSAGPSTPVEILGLPEVPEAGEVFYAVTDEKVAKQLSEKRRNQQREQQLKSSARVSLDDLFNQIKEGQVKDLNIIVKADVQGSVEAVKQSLAKLSTDEVRVKIIHGGVGAVTESDVKLAEVSNAIIIGFNVRPGANVTEAAEAAKVDIRLYRVIYNAIEDIQAAMKGMLEPTFKEVILGHTEIRQTFKVSGIGTIGGCYVTDGKIVRNADVRVVRDGIVIHEGKLASLKRFKDDAKEVAQGFECGLSLEKFNDIKEGDVIEAYMMEEVKR